MFSNQGWYIMLSFFLYQKGIFLFSESKKNSKPVDSILPLDHCRFTFQRIRSRCIIVVFSTKINVEYVVLLLPSPLKTALHVRMDVMVRLLRRNFPNRNKGIIYRLPSIIFENPIARADGGDAEAFGAKNILLIILHEVVVDACRIRDVASYESTSH